MGTARRLYLYVVSLVSLLALTGGAGSLLQLFLGRLEDGLGGTAVMGGSMSSGQAAMSVAMIAVGGPVWAVHWWLVRRGMRSGAADGAEDRASAVRAWYLAIVMAVALSAAVGGVVGTLSTVIADLIGADGEGSWSLPLAVALVATPTWAIHARMRWVEIRATRMQGAAAWVGRLYRYLALYALLVLTVGNTVWLLETLLSVSIGRPDFDQGQTWWRLAAAGQVAAILGAGTALMIHWREATTTIRDRGRIGEDERATRLRAAFFGASMLTLVTWTAVGITGALADAGRLLTGMTTGGIETWLELVAGPPVALLPAGIAAWWLAAALRREAADVGPRQVLAARRLVTHLVAVVGLALLAVGVVQLLGTGLERLAGGGTEAILYGQHVNAAVPGHVAQVLVGLVLWLPAWAAVLEARRREPEIERTAAASRAYLFLVVGASLVAAVPATIAILYRLLEPLLGGSVSGTLLLDIAIPVATLLVALAAGAYHGRILLGDLAIAAAGPLAADLAAEVSAIPAPGEAVELLLELPAGGDTPAVLEGLRAALPPGAHLRVRPVA